MWKKKSRPHALINPLSAHWTPSDLPGEMLCLSPEILFLWKHKKPFQLCSRKITSGEPNFKMIPTRETKMEKKKKKQSLKLPGKLTGVVILVDRVLYQKIRDSVGRVVRSNNSVVR